MGMRALALFLFLFSSALSQDCANARLGATDPIETVQIYSNEYALDDDHVSYEIASSPPSNSFDQVSDSIRILVNNQSSCPSACTVTLNRYTDSFQGAESTVLFFDTDHSFYLPSHYMKDNKTTLVCVANNGSCGATVPIYRYYKISNGGVFHAYSFDQDITYDGYNQEFLPICYAWSISTATVASRPTCGTLTFDIPPEMLSDLNIYDNNLPGIERDHYYTTLHSMDPSVSSYNQTGVLGKILTSSKSTACSCLVKLQQQFDNQTGYFHRLDHKLIITGQEPNRPYEEYFDTGETLYCSKRLGDCGATLPLWKHFVFYDVDTVYTTDSSPLPMSYLYPQTPLCYIWPTNYAPNVSNILSGTSAPAPPIPVTTQLPNGATTTPSGTIGTGSTPLSDVVGGSSPTTPSTPSTGTISTGSTISSGSLGTTQSTPVSSQSTISVWGTENPTAPSTVSTASTPSSSTLTTGSTVTTASTPITSQSTISVWGTGSTPSTLSTVSTPTSATVTTNSPATTQSTPVSSQSTISGWSTGNPSTPSTMSTVSMPTSATGITGSPANTASTSATSQSTISVWGTGTPSSLSTVSTVSTPSTASTGTVGATASTISVWGTSMPQVGTTGTSSGSTATTPRLSDSGVVTPVIIIPQNLSVTTPEYPVTLGEEVTEANLETEVPLDEEFNQTPETFTLSNFWLTTPSTPAPAAPTVSLAPVSDGTLLPITGTSTVTPSTTGTTGTTSGITPVSPVTANAIPNPTGTIPPIDTGTGEASIATTAVTSEHTTVTTPPPPVMVTGPLVFIIPTIAQTDLPSTVPIPAATPQPTTVTPGTTHSLDASPATPTPQHLAQAAPTYSIVGGALDSFTNPPIIAALISSSVASTPAPTQSQPTQAVLNSIPSTGSVTNTVTTTVSTSTQEPGIIWKAGDWISNAWHSVFGGNDQTVVNASSTSPPVQVSTTPRPIGGLVGSLINSGGNTTNSSNPISSFLNSTGNFIDQHLNSNTSLVNNTVNWIDNKLNSTGEFISNAWDSLKSENTTSGFVNNTQTWIDGALNTTGGFLTNAWNSLSNGNGTTGNVVNGTQTWIGGAVNSTGNFLSNAWNSLSTNNSTSSLMNNTETWIGGALNSTGGFLENAWNSLGSSNGTSDQANNKTWVGGAVDSTGQFLSNAWNSLTSNNNSAVDSTKTWVAGAVNSTGEFLSNAWNQTKETSGNVLNTSQTWVSEHIEGASGNASSATDGAKNLIENITALASAPHSNPVGSVANIILPLVNSTTPEPANGKVEWNGGVVRGPITG